LFDSSLFADNFNKMLWKIWEKFTTKWIIELNFIINL
jgi:hypothetical protein